MKTNADKALLVYKSSNKRMHVINYSEYLRKEETILKLWRLATEEEIIEFQRKRGQNIEIKAPDIRVKAVQTPKETPKEAPKEKVILRSDPIEEITPEKKEIKNIELKKDS